VIYILTGQVGAGKTSFLQRSLPTLRARHAGLDGYLSLRVSQGGETAGYDLFDVATAGRTPLLRRGGDPSGQTVGPYVLLPGGLRAAEAILGRRRPGGLLIVDELGPLELAGGGVRPALSAALAAEDRPALVVVRETLVADVRALFAGRALEVIPLASAAGHPPFAGEGGAA
jgi:nucleoside-triphosphatase THEP1